MLKTCVTSLLLVALLTSCMTSYEPRRSARLAMVVEAGNTVLVRDGRRYGLRLFGGELEEAVAPNALAMDHAAAFRHQLVGGFALSLVSAVPLGMGVGLYAEEASQHRNTTTGLGLLTGGLIAYVVGLGLILSAQPHMYDAINVYNDWVDVGMPADATAPF